jgi:hypothetical protein
MMALPEQDKSILVGAILISQWVQTEQEQMISLPAVELQLESITKRVTQLLADFLSLRIHQEHFKYIYSQRGAGLY